MNPMDDYWDEVSIGLRSEKEMLEDAVEFLYSTVDKIEKLEGYSYESADNGPEN